MSLSNRQRYERVPSQAASSSESPCPIEDANPTKSSECLQRGTSTINVRLMFLLLLGTTNVIQLLVLISVLILGSGNSSRPALMHGDTYGNHGLNEDSKHTSAYSSAPILDKVDMRLHLETLNGALRDNTSVWRMSPSPHVDAAWNWISAEDMQIITVSAADVKKVGKNATVSVKAPQSWGLGDDAYIAQVEVFHQIHCLNELRKELYPDYYYGGRGRTELDMSHKTHCVHMLLQNLMCNADTGIITHYWLHDELYSEPKTRPFADFSVEKKCRDFEAVMGWLRKEGGVRDFASKFPMEHPDDAPVTYNQGYSTEGRKQDRKMQDM